MRNNILTYKDYNNEITVEYDKGDDKYDMTIMLSINGSKFELSPFEAIDYFADSYETIADDVMHDMFSRYLIELVVSNNIYMETYDLIINSGIAELVDRMIEQDYLLTKNNR